MFPLFTWTLWAWFNGLLSGVVAEWGALGPRGALRWASHLATGLATDLVTDGPQRA